MNKGVHEIHQWVLNVVAFFLTRHIISNKNNYANIPGTNIIYQQNNSIPYYVDKKYDLVIRFRSNYHTFII